MTIGTCGGQFRTWLQVLPLREWGQVFQIAEFQYFQSPAAIIFSSYGSDVSDQSGFWEEGQAK